MSERGWRQNQTESAVLATDHEANVQDVLV
jgi:hypothetical protein